MPGSRVHEFIDWINFGKVYRKIHRKMDEPYWYLGRSHRVLFHDHASAYAIAEKYYPGDPDAVKSAYYHIYYDELCSSDPGYKKMLERFEVLSRKQRRREQVERERAEKALKKDPVLARLLKDAEQMKEIERLWHLLFK